MGDGCDFARWEEDEKRDLSKQLRVECALGTGYDDEERYLHQMLNLLREQHDKAAKPYYDRLAAIHAMKPVSMVVTADQARAMGFTLST